MTRFGQFVAALAIFGGTIALIVLFVILRPKAETEKKEDVVPTVEVMTVTPTDFKVTIPSQGILEASTASTLAAEVAGKVVWVSPKFEVGGIFDENDTILSIDSADYEANLEQAKAESARAILDLAMEEGRKLQAIKDWDKLGGGEEATPLALRVPQVASAKAAVVAAEAAQAKAQRDLDRTDVIAPYKCRIAGKQTDIGSFVGVGSPLADIEEASLLEVRLPISVDDSVFYGPDSRKKAAATLEADFNGEVRLWPAVIVRDEGAIDRSSRSIYLVASVSREKDNPNLQAGLFVRAKVEGDTLKNIFRVPRYAFLDSTRLLVVEEKIVDGEMQDQLQFRDVEVLRTESEEMIVSSGLKKGDRICLTTIDAPIKGTRIEVITPKGKVEVETETEDGKKPVADETKS